MTYAELLETSERYATELKRNGVAADDRVVLIAPSVPAFVVAYLGIQAAGAVVVPMNTMSTLEEITYVVRDSAASLIIAWPEVAAAAHQAAESTGILVLDLIPDRSSEQERATAVERSPDDTAAILYTSGTTGRPKGAQLTVSNLLLAAEACIEVSGATPRERNGTGLPLFHIFGQVTVMMATLTGGGSMTLISPFDPDALVRAIAHEKLTTIFGVPTMWNALLRSAAGKDPDQFASIRLVVSGGAPLPPPVAQQFETKFGCQLRDGYGLTESASLGSFNRLGSSRTPGSAGQPSPRTRVEIRDPDGRPVSVGEVGEIHLQGPSIMKGYWNRPEETAQTLVGGWLRTGDLGKFDDHANLFIVDRLKDLIIRGGYNVYPGEVEAILYEHPHIVEAAVIGVPDEHYGEEVAAIIVLDLPGAVTGADITAWTRTRMSAYKIPRIVQFAETLPKGSTGKILKRAISRNGLQQPGRAQVQAAPRQPCRPSPNSGERL